MLDLQFFKKCYRLDKTLPDVLHTLLVTNSGKPLYFPRIPVF